MFKSIVLKKVVTSILALATVSTFSMVSCFAMDHGNVPDDQDLPDFVITTNNRGQEYDEEYAKEIMSPETSGSSDLEDVEELDPDILFEEEEEYDEEYAKEIMSPETSDSSDPEDVEELDPGALLENEEEKEECYEEYSNEIMDSEITGDSDFNDNADKV